MNYGICILFLLSTILLNGQERSFTVEVGADSLLFGNPVEIRFMARNLVGQMTIPDLEGVAIVAGPNRSSSMQIINGTTSRSESASLFVQPENEGMIYIPSASFITSDSTWKSRPHQVVVLPNPQRLRKNYGVPGSNTLAPRPEPRKKLKITKI